MKLHPFIASTVAIGSLTAIGLSAAQQTADGFSFKMPGRGWLQVAGACNADPEHIDCWKPTGEPDPKLTELINAYFLINPQQRLEIRYKHRSLMLVSKSIFNNVQGQGNVNFNGLQVDPGGNLNQQGNIGYNGQGEEVTMFYWYYPAESTTSVDVTAMLNVTTEGVKIPLKIDAEGSLSGGKVRFTKIEKASDKEVVPNPYGNPNSPSGSHWYVNFELTGAGSEPVTSIYAFALDQDGNQISQVDTRGNPVTPKPNERRYNGIQPYYAIAGVSGNRIILAVNPDKVSSLVINGNSQKKVTFKKVALQPNK
jgi:hypothetical protein